MPAAKDSGNGDPDQNRFLLGVRNWGLGTRLEIVERLLGRASARDETVGLPTKSTQSQTQVRQNKDCNQECPVISYNSYHHR